MQFSLRNMLLAVGLLGLTLGLVRFSWAYLPPLVALTAVAAILCGCCLIGYSARMRVYDDWTIGLKQGLVGGVGCLVVVFAILFAVVSYLAERCGFE